MTMTTVRWSAALLMMGAAVVSGGNFFLGGPVTAPRETVAASAAPPSDPLRVRTFGGGLPRAGKPATDGIPLIITPENDTKGFATLAENPRVLLRGNNPGRTWVVEYQELVNVFALPPEGIGTLVEAVDVVPVFTPSGPEGTTGVGFQVLKAVPMGSKFKLVVGADSRPAFQGVELRVHYR